MYSINRGSVSQGSFFHQFISNLEFPFINLEFAFQTECFLVNIKLVNDGWVENWGNKIAKSGKISPCSLCWKFKGTDIFLTVS